MTYYYNREIKWDENGEELILDMPSFEDQIPLRDQMFDEEMDDLTLDMFLSFAAETYSYKLTELKEHESVIPIPLADGKKLYHEFFKNNLSIIDCSIKEILKIKESIPLILELDVKFGQKTLNEVEKAKKKFEETKPEDRKIPYRLKDVLYKEELQEEDCYEKYKDVWKKRLDKKYANESENRIELLWELLELELRERNKR